MSASRILTGDCLSILPTLPDHSVNCCVTSPPYFGLRDYGHDGQIGLEPTPDEYVSKMVQLFREVRRVLRDDGTLWLNLGDSYSAGGRGGGAKGSIQSGNIGSMTGSVFDAWKVPGFKPKNLLGIPWRVALALQADGWYLRQDIIWHKPNPMPESVTDRCTKAHEYIFLLSKSEKYHFDAEAIAEPAANPEGFKYEGGYQEMMQHNEREGRLRADGSTAQHSRTETGAVPHFASGHGDKRNKRSVWTVSPKPFKGAHFATFPTELILPCVLAGCPAGGTVLDPFNGAGTSGLVALSNGRNYVGIELNPEYVALSMERMGVLSSLIEVTA